MPNAECDASANHLWHCAGHFCTSCIYCTGCTWSQQRHRREVAGWVVACCVAEIFQVGDDMSICSNSTGENVTR